MSFETAKNHLATLGLSHKITVFDTSSATVSLAAKAAGCEEARIAKSLTFDVGGETYLVVVAGDMKVNNGKFKRQFAHKATFLTADSLKERIGHSVGGVCPFAIHNSVNVYLDISLKRFDEVLPACGSANSCVRLTISELEQASGYIDWVDICLPITSQA